MNIEDLTIKDAKALAAMFSGCVNLPGTTDHGLKIVVIDRGFVYIGKVTTDAEWCKITGCKNIRKWGSTKGLGELVNGPLGDTVLDACGDLNIPIHALISIMGVVEEKWTRSLSI